MVKNSDITKKLFESMIDVIGRRSSEDYAIIAVSNTLKKLSDKYSFFNYIKIRNISFSEIEDLILIDDLINKIDELKIGNALNDFVSVIVSSTGSNAGFFLIKELKNKIGPNYEMYLKNIGLDFDYLQLNYVVEIKQKDTGEISDEDLLKKTIKAILDILEIGKTRSEAVIILNKTILELKERYDNYKYITIKDVRQSLGGEEVEISKELNNLNSTDVSKLILYLLEEVNKFFIESKDYLFYDKFKNKFKIEYLVKFEKIGIVLDKKQIKNEAIFREIIKTLISVLSKASTQRYAVFAMNTLLKKLYTKYEFLKYVVINTSNNDEDYYEINIMNNLDEVNNSETRRAIQKLLEEIINSFGDELGNHFIADFRNSLEKDCLNKIENLGVNLHMLELKQELL